VVKIYRDRQFFQPGNQRKGPRTIINSAAREWLTKAREDLLAVERLIGDDALTNVAAFMP